MEILVVSDKGIITNTRKGNTQMQLYNLENDIRENMM